MTAQWFGDYEIVQRLRVGGMATLYLARRHGTAGFTRLVALKMIHPHLIEQPGFVEMFVDEARICSQISHPQVVHVEAFGVIDEVHYLVMEYVDGCSVNDLLIAHQRADRRLDPELAARIVMQIAGGLHAAHEARDADGQPLEIIHRDISPSNILISTDGHAKLIDFGIAKARNRVTETAAGVTLKGKLNYVAPEQATSAAVDRRCDLFSLGVVFWEMLVGQPLFPGQTHAGLFNRLTRTDVAAPSSLNPAVPAALDAIVLAMLQHDPADRPQTAAELERRIASAVPGAANRDASELAALAIEARDQRAARRAESGAGSHPSFSPTPRSPQPEASQAEIEVAPAPPPGRWTGRRLQLGVAAVLCLGILLGAVLARPGARPAPRVTRGVAMPVEPAALARTAVAPRPSQVVPAAPEPAAPIARAVAALAPVPEPVLPVRVPARAATPRRDVVRVARPRPIHASTDEVTPAAPAPASGPVQFDDVGDEPAALAAPLRTKPPIVPTFDN